MIGCIIAAMWLGLLLLILIYACIVDEAARATTIAIIGVLFFAFATMFSIAKLIECFG